MALLLRLAFLLASATAAPAMALSLEKAVGQVPIRFSPGEARLPASQTAALARELPRIEMLVLETLVIEARFSAQPGPGRATQAVAKQRAAAVANVFIRAGVDPRRVLQLVKPARTRTAEATTADDAELDLVDVDWSGQCKPGSGSACRDAYFK